MPPRQHQAIGPQVLLPYAFWPYIPYRGQGLEQRLVEKCLDRAARSLKISKMSLSTGSFLQAACRLYERLEFQRIPEYDWKPGPLAYSLDVQQP